MHRVAEVSGLSQPGLDRLRAQVPSIFLGPFSSCCVLLSLVQQLFPPCAGLREIGAPKVMCCGGWEHHGDVHEKYKIIVLMGEVRVTQMLLCNRTSFPLKWSLKRDGEVELLPVPPPRPPPPADWAIQAVSWS